MRIRLAIPDHLVTPSALEAALEAVALADAEAIRRGEVPHIADVLRSGRVKWKPEPFLDGEHFDMAHQVQSRGWGDCDDLAPWLTGSMLAHGEDAGARTRVVQTGPDRWHALTQTSDGKILDPSVWAGMGRRSSPATQGVSGALARPFARPNGGALCVRPHAGKWWARCDVPWPAGVTGHLASIACSQHPDVALNSAVAGAVTCGEQVQSPMVDRARDVARMLLADAKDLCQSEGEVGNIFGSIFHALKGPLGYVLNPAMALAAHTSTDKQFAPLRSAAANLLPGGGALANLANAAPSALAALAHGGGSQHVPGAIVDPASGAVSVPLEAETPAHGQNVMLYFHPKDSPGPVVARF